MQADKGSIHKQSGGQGLNDGDDGSLTAGLAQSADPELAADGESDEAQGDITHKTHASNKIMGVEAQARDIQPAQHKRTNQHTCHQVTGDIGQVQLGGQPGTQKAHDHGHANGQ